MLFVDSADPVLIREMFELGIVRGVTTNPLLLPRTPDLTQNFTLRDILKIVAAQPAPGPIPVCVQLVSIGMSGMLSEAAALRTIFLNEPLVFKIPFSEEGLRVASKLASTGFRVNMTSLMSAEQAYLALEAGAEYVSLFYGRISDAGNDPRAVIADTRRMIDREDRVAQIIAGSIRQVGDVMSALVNGAHIVTVKPEILRKMMRHPMTEQVNEEFRQAAEKNNALYPKDP